MQASFLRSITGVHNAVTSNLAPLPAACVCVTLSANDFFARVKCRAKAKAETVGATLTKHRPTGRSDPQRVGGDVESSPSMTDTGSVD